MSRNDAFDEGVGKSRERNVVKPRSLEERMPMLFDPQYDAPWVGGHPDAAHMQKKYPKAAPNPNDAHNKKSYGTHGVPLDDKWSKTFNPEKDEDK